MAVDTPEAHQVRGVGHGPSGVGACARAVGLGVVDPEAEQELVVAGHRERALDQVALGLGLEHQGVGRREDPGEDR